MTNDPLPEPSARSTILAFLLVAAAVIGGAVLLVTSRPATVQIAIQPPQPTLTPTATTIPAPTATPGPVTVYITGAVVNPNIMVNLPFGSRVEDALQTAGGALADADLARVNLAARLRDGDQVHVPFLNQETALATPSGGVVVAINSATVDELDDLPGVGPSLAAAIIAYREANGPFANLEALDQVEGIGPSLLQDLKDRVIFD